MASSKWKVSMIILLSFFTLFFINSKSSFAAVIPDYVGSDILYGSSGTGYKMSGIKTITDNDMSTSHALAGDESSVEFKVANYTVVGYSIKAFVDKSSKMRVTVGGHVKEFTDNAGVDIFVPLDSERLTVASTIKIEARQGKVYVSDLKVYEKRKMPPSDITDLTEAITHDSVRFTYKLPTQDFSHLKVFINGSLNSPTHKSDSFSIAKMKPDTVYTVKFVAVSPEGLESKGVEKVIRTSKEPSPDDIKELKEIEKTHDSIKFGYKFPKGNFSHVKIYRDDKVIADNVKVEEYIDKGLKGSTEYTYKFVSVSSSGLESNGVVRKVKTEEAPNLSKPIKPQNPDITPKDRSLVVNLSDYNAGVPIKGYHIFIDGVRVNENLVTGRSYAVKGLQNGQSYGVQIKAVSKWDVESDLSNAVTGVPKVPVVPEIVFNFGLGTLVEGIKNWFGGLWPIIAFSIAIPLAFIFAFNTKKLFMR
ncbi:fibronectin type III domain-containing protein [Bacillus paranthracis]|uniref:fibronectin type III domain-containing protein n=1 Tax=Bacillus paranthracis TaxID=2026186 RepID=UPI002E1F81C6|nr:fibronectin type III domain-containing protein [Bacillus paranthracis]MED1679441.1 fibronectin type III domain-containing protein [Bacillus paranthracis]